MKTISFACLLLPALSALLLIGCGKDKQPPANEQTDNDSPPPKSQVASFAATPEPLRDPEVEKEIDAFFAENEGMEDLQKLMTNPTFMVMMDDMMDNWEPSAEMEKRLIDAMQMTVAAKMPDSPIANALADHGNGKGLENSGQSLTIGTNDTEMVREMVGYVLMQDPEGFVEMFCKAMEDSAVATAIDPDAKTPIFIQNSPAPNGEADDQKGN